MDVIFYSVGIDTSDLKTGTPNMTISSGVMTFTVAQTGDIGVGDVVLANSMPYMIVGKISTTVWNVMDVDGTPAIDTGSVAVISIRRAFNSLNAALDGAVPGVAMILGSSNLSGFQINIACYADGDDNGRVYMGTDSWHNESATEYIRIYTPTDTTSECNTSQRHTGIVDGGGYRMTYQGTGSLDHTITIGVDYVRVEGIYIKVFGGNVGNQCAIQWGGSYNTRYPIARYNLIHFDNFGGNGGRGISVKENSYGTTASPAIISDNIIISTNTTRLSYGIYHQDNNTSRTSDIHIYNNTVIGAAFGYWIDRKNDVGSQVEAILKNNIAQDNSVAGFSFDNTSTYDADYNLSEDASADDEGGTGNVISTALTFVDGTGGGSTDFHLVSTDAAAIGAGVGPGADSNVSTLDIDGDTRSGATCDIGADEIPSGIILPIIDNSYRQRRS